MGTSQTQAPQPRATIEVEMPPLPPGVTQEAINAAIAQVEQTGTTDRSDERRLGTEGGRRA